MPTRRDCPRWATRRLWISSPATWSSVRGSSPWWTCGSTRRPTVSDRRSRRAFVLDIARAAGVAAPALAVLEGRAVALGTREETDMTVLHGALMLEHHAIALYGYGLQRGLFPIRL